MRRTLTLTLTMLALGGAATASAEELCVSPQSTCDAARTYPTVQQALDAAGGDGDADRVTLGAATYTAPGAAGFSYLFAAPVEIVGQGEQTLLVGNTMNAPVLDLESSATARSLKLRIAPGAPEGVAGLRSEGTASGIVVDAPGAQENRFGFYLREGADLDDSRVDLPPSNTSDTVGVYVDGSGSAVTDVAIHATHGVESTGSGALFNRVSVTAAINGIVLRKAGDVRNCLVRIRPTTTGYFGIAAFDTNGPVKVDNCTVIAPELDDGGTALNSTASSADASLVANSVALRGFEYHVSRMAQGGNTANLSVGYSSMNPAKKAVSGNGVLTLGPQIATHANAGFLDEGNRDLRLRHDSPFVDKGKPGSIAAPLDLLGKPRVVDGDLAAGSRVDIGAYEYQRAAPSVSIDGPSEGAPAAQLTFSASASDPDGDALSLAWKVDGADAGGGTSLTRGIGGPGTHTVQVVVTDPTGRTASAERVVTVAAPPTAASPAEVKPPVPPAWTVVKRAPKLTGLRLSRALVQLVVDQPARVTVTVQRKRGKRFRTLRTRTVRASRAGRVRVRLGTLRRGRYRVLVVATSSAGVRSAQLRRTLTVR